ncbi:hypothetical protein J14TS5_57780 [Paenibacillus lautus]|nr:hypothetical protein J14TS5_57780 [Paenibacillus lautus]
MPIGPDILSSYIAPGSPCGEIRGYVHKQEIGLFYSMFFRIWFATSKVVAGAAM